MYRVWTFLTNHGLLVGAAIALVWANLHHDSYRALVDLVLVENRLIGEPVLSETGAILTRSLTVHYLVNNLLMAFFFALAGKEVWEAIVLEDGSLRGRKAATPIVATLGGMAGPALIYLGVAATLGSDTYDAIVGGWAIPTATDIAFAYLFGRLIFGTGHPALRFLLLLAIADDALGLIIIAVFYPTGEVAPEWLMLSALAAVLAFFLFNWLPRELGHGRDARDRSIVSRLRLSVWPYLAAGAVSWFGFQQAGLHPALGLLPILPAVPHADRSFAASAAGEPYPTDTLDRLQSLLRRPVEGILCLFGLVNAGVALGAIGEPSWAVFLALVIGKPLGVIAAGWIAAHFLGLGLPRGMSTGDLAVSGCVAGIGFTVSIFIASVAFAPGAGLDGLPIEDAAKLGALLSVASALTAFAVARLTGVERRHA